MNQDILLLLFLLLLGVLLVGWLLKEFWPLLVYIFTNRK